MNKRTLLGTIVAIAATVMIGLAFQASGVGHAAGANEPPAKPAGLEAGALVPTLHRVNQMEIDAGKIAQATGASQAVKNYGRKLEQDHQAADRKLEAYAQASRVALDGPVPANVEKTLDHAERRMERLRPRIGTDFDLAFAQAMKRDHDKVIGIVDSSRQLLTDQKLTALLDELEPTLRTHEQIASDIVADLNGHGKVFSQDSEGAPSAVHGRRGDHGR